MRCVYVYVCVLSVIKCSCLSKRFCSAYKVRRVINQVTVGREENLIQLEVQFATENKCSKVIPDKLFICLARLH